MVLDFIQFSLTFKISFKRGIFYTIQMISIKKNFNTHYLNLFLFFNFQIIIENHAMSTNEISPISILQQSSISPLQHRVSGHFSMFGEIKLGKNRSLYTL